MGGWAGGASRGAPGDSVSLQGSGERWHAKRKLVGKSKGNKVDAQVGVWRTWEPHICCSCALANLAHLAH